MSRREYDFPADVRRAAFKNAGGMCAVCWAATAGPSSTPGKPSDMGECGHIHSHSDDGPRYIDGLPLEACKSVENAIWLCRNHHVDVDGDESKYTAEQLLRMRAIVEARAKAKQGIPQNPEIVGKAAPTAVLHNSGTIGSIGQIAGGNIYNAPPQRTLRDKGIDRDLLQRIRARPVEVVELSARMGDVEAQAFHAELRELLPGMCGWSIGGMIGHSIGTPGQYGIQIDTKAPATDTDDPLALFAAWLRDEGFEVVLATGRHVNAVTVRSQRPGGAS